MVYCWRNNTEKDFTEECSEHINNYTLAKMFDTTCIYIVSASVNFFFSLSLSPADSPRSTSITVFPPGEVSEGGSVTLTCTSDAAPPVESFAWFKGTGQCLLLHQLAVSSWVTDVNCVGPLMISAE